MTTARKIAKGVALSLGLLNASVSMSRATDTREVESNVLVCQNEHPAKRIRQPRTCDECGEVALGSLAKARKVEGGLVVIPPELLETVTAGPEQTKRAEVAVHPREQVEVGTGIGDKVYYLHADPGHEVAYATIAALVESHPDKAFVARWAPRSQVSLFILRAADGVLLMQERTLTTTMREAPASPAEADAKLVKMADTLVKRLVSRFNPDDYEDNSREAFDKAIAKLPVIPTEGSGIQPQAVDEVAAALKEALAKTPARRTRKKEASNA